MGVMVDGDGNFAVDDDVRTLLNICFIHSLS